MKANEFIIEAPRHEKIAAKRASLRISNIPKITKAIISLLKSRIDVIIADTDPANPSGAKVDKQKVTDVIMQILEKSTKVDLNDDKFEHNVTNLISIILRDPEKIKGNSTVASLIGDIVTKALTMDQAATSANVPKDAEVFFDPREKNTAYTNKDGHWLKWHKTAAGFKLLEKITGNKDMGTLDQFIKSKQIELTPITLRNAGNGIYKFTPIKGPK